MRSLDLRQMRGEPGFFGSYGFGGWAGVGEAKPIPTMHELGHSYWGALPVVGRADLTWQRQDGEEIPPALAAYHQDLLAFMQQPPDKYELLRQRLRHLPGLSSENTEPLFHSMEADVAYTTGGDLSLVPPILQKYWAYFLEDGPFGSWENAAGWYLSLDRGQRTTANKFLGFAHLDLDDYRELPAHRVEEAFMAGAAETLAGEERQRLTDLAEQFDLLIGDPQLEENFQFWRGYLRDKVALHRSHPEHLKSLSLPRANELSDALSFLNQLQGTPKERASKLQSEIGALPFLVNFLPAVDDRTLVELFASEPALPDGPTLQATASFVKRLQRFGNLVEGVLAGGRTEPSLGAAELAAFLDETALERKQDLRLFFDLIIAADRDLTARILDELDDGTIRQLMVPVPTQLRAALEPQALLDKLGIYASAPEDELRSGISLLVEENSGNYRIEAPFLEHLYEVVALRAGTDPAGAARTIGEAAFPLEGFIMRQPAATSTVLSGDIGLAVQLVRNSDPVLAPPARIIYRLIGADPSLAATLVAALEDLGEQELVTESLAYFAYDKARSERIPGLPISLAKDGDFLGRLLQLKGARWLEERLAESVELNSARVEAGEIDPQFLDEYRATLESAADLATADNRALKQVIHSAFD